MHFFKLYLLNHTFFNFLILRDKICSSQPVYRLHILGNSFSYLYFLIAKTKPYQITHSESVCTASRSCGCPFEGRLHSWNRLNLCFLEVYLSLLRMKILKDLRYIREERSSLLIKISITYFTKYMQAEST